MTDEKELGRVTLKQYFRLMKAARLRNLDKEFDIHLSAWKNREIEATRDKGKYIYTNFEKFADFKNRENALLGQAKEKPKNNNLAYLMAKANHTKKEGE